MSTCDREAKRTLINLIKLFDAIRWWRIRASSDEPVHPVPLLSRRFGKKPSKGAHQIFWIAQSTAMEPPRRGEDDADVMFAARRPRSHDSIEVLQVLGDEDALFSRREAEQILVWHHGQPDVVGSRNYVVTLLAEALCSKTRVVDVE